MTNVTGNDAPDAIARLAAQITPDTPARDIDRILDGLTVEDGVFDQLLDLLCAVAVNTRRRPPAWHQAQQAIDRLWELRYAVGDAAIAVGQLNA
ncbi:hypothetical protein ABZW30_08240 [Kitasatospora sp. NPDC004669]|uniref:hypothetical protein n=1 Tax=Kitasatospora sp. NPDC004669 TaxID=3154555 RepID=UPI0033B2DE22